MVQIRCSCSEIFFGIDEFLYHYRSHGKEFKLTKCYFQYLSDCNRSFDCMKSFRKHLNAHKSDKVVNQSTNHHIEENFVNSEKDSKHVDMSPLSSIVENPVRPEVDNNFLLYVNDDLDNNIDIENLELEVINQKVNILPNTDSWRDTCLKLLDYPVTHDNYRLSTTFNLALYEAAEKFISNVQNFKIPRNVIQKTIQQTMSFFR